MADFKVVNWTPNEVVGEEKMEQMNTNMVWLRDNTPRAIYTLPSGFRRDTGLRIAAGRTNFAARRSDTARSTVYFNNLFVEGCQPIITTGLISNKQVNVVHAISGIGQLHPDARGFEINVAVNASKKKHDKIKGFYVSWIAMGYYVA
jgi:hypothetical protein